MLSCSAGLSSTTSSRLRRGAAYSLMRASAASSLPRGRLGHEGECAARQAVVPVFVQGQHLDWDVAGGRVLFQMIEHGPAQHVRQENIERDGGGMEFAGQRERFGAASWPPAP